MQKVFLKLPNFHMLLKQKSPLLPRNLVLRTFGRLLIVLSTKVNLLYLFYSMVQRCCLLHLKKAKLFAKSFSKNSYLDDSVISLPTFSSRTNLKLHHISITATMVKKVMTNLDSSKVSAPDCIPVVVNKNYIYGHIVIVISISNYSYIYWPLIWIFIIKLLKLT